MSISDYALVLDPAIRNWVVLPMIVLMTLVGLGRAYAQQLMQTAPKIDEKAFEEIRYKQGPLSEEQCRILLTNLGGRAGADAPPETS